MKNKKQHWVPRSYLAAWRDPVIGEGIEPYVWVFPKESGEGRKKAPKNIFHESDMYTIQRADGVRDLWLEHCVCIPSVVLRRTDLGKSCCQPSFGMRT